MMAAFQLVSDYQPAGDQPKGEALTASKIIAAFNRPTLVLAHNKTLAARPSCGYGATCGSDL